MKNRKKAVAAIVAAVLLLVVLLFPIRMNLKDGGSVQYKSLTYSITKVHRLMPESEAEKEGKIKPFEDGYQIEAELVVGLIRLPPPLELGHDTGGPLPAYGGHLLGEGQGAVDLPIDVLCGGVDAPPEVTAIVQIAQDRLTGLIRQIRPLASHAVQLLRAFLQKLLPRRSGPVQQRGDGRAWKL